MSRYCDGDVGAFRELYRLLAPRLLAYLVRMSAGNRALAEDLLQQTFLKVHRAREVYVRGAAPGPWIYAIAHRTFLDEMRRRRRSAPQTGSEPYSAAPQSGPPAEPRADLSGRPEDGAAEPVFDPDLTQAALAALQQLPEAQRQAVVLTKLDGHSLAEAAIIAGTTPGAMKLRAHRGYVAVRRALGLGDGSRGKGR